MSISFRIMLICVAFAAVLAQAVDIPDQNNTAPAQPAPKRANADEPAELPRAKLEDGVFLQSGELKVMENEIQKYLVLMLTDEKKRNPRNVPSADRVMQARIQIAQMLLQNALMINYAHDHNLAASDKDVDEFIDLKKIALKRENTTFEQMLADSGQTEAEFRTFWRARLAIEKKAAATVTDADVDALFNENKDTLPLRSVAHILFQFHGCDASPKALTRTEDEARAMAEAALKEIKAGKDFNELVAKSEDDASKANGGVLSYFPLKGKDAMVDAFGKAAYALEKKGDISPVVKTPYGFHIIKLIDVRDDDYKKQMRHYLGVKKYDELMRPVIEAALDAAKFNEKLTAPPEAAPAEAKAAK
ncbi:MAG TPA: peptidylprolyl isomerase [Planctomycetota bacterium]|nr:peptidylprolyl isomerase [Planctomycetota bacterium]